MTAVREPQVRWRDIPASDFPLTVTYWDAETGEWLREDVIPGPGVYEVPVYAPRRVRVRIVEAWRRQLPV